MNNLKIKVYKRVLKEVSKKFDGAEDFMNSRIEEIFSQGKLSTEEVICVLYFLVSFFSIKIVFLYKI